MFDLDFWKEILLTLQRNHKRNLTTAFGVFWGVLMLVILLGAGMSMKKSMSREMGGMASNSTVVFSRPTSLPYEGLQSGRKWNLNVRTLGSIAANVEGVEVVSGVVSGRSAQTTVYKNRQGNYATLGYMPSFQQINPQNILSGRYINEIDMTYRRKVCVVGSRVAQELLYDREDPVGAILSINGIHFRVVGVVGKAGRLEFSDTENSVILPFTSLESLYHYNGKVDYMLMAAKPGYDIDRIGDQAQAIIANLHMISPQDPNAIGIQSLRDDYQSAIQFITWLQVLIWLVGGGTLLAGIIGISNIMLVVVKERTNEMGIRRALGATPRSLITQILAESFVLTFTAGAAGLTVGVVALAVADQVLGAFVAQTPGEVFDSWMISFSLGLLSLGIIVLGSLMAGTIPALRALRIKPIEAIREE